MTAPTTAVPQPASFGYCGLCACNSYSPDCRRQPDGAAACGCWGCREPRCPCYLPTEPEPSTDHQPNPPPTPAAAEPHAALQPVPIDQRPRLPHWTRIWGLS